MSKVKFITLSLCLLLFSTFIHSDDVETRDQVPENSQEYIPDMDPDEESNQ